MPLRLLLPPSVGPSRAAARAELLDHSLAADLSESATIAVARDYADLERRTAAGDVDLAWLPPSLCARLEPSLRERFKCVRHGRGTYRSALFTRTVDEPALRDVGFAGARCAWVDPLSLGGYRLAKAALSTHGFSPDALGAQRFVGSYPEAIRLVLHGEADLAAIMVRDDSPHALEDSLARYGGKRASEELSLVLLSAPSPNDAIAITRALDGRRAERLASRVFEREGARARAAFCLALDAEGFERASPEEYRPLAALIA